MESLNQIFNSTAVTAKGYPPSAGALSSTNEIRLLQIQERLTSIALGPRTDVAEPAKLLDRVVEVLKAKPELTSLVAEAVQLIQTSKNCRSFGDHLGRLMSGLVYDLGQIREGVVRIQAKIASLLTEVKSIVTSDSGISTHIEQNIFDPYPLKTPNALGDRACDTLVEAILEAYGHQNAGKTLLNRRNVRESSWEQFMFHPPLRNL